MSIGLAADVDPYLIYGAQMAPVLEHTIKPIVLVTESIVGARFTDQTYTSSHFGRGSERLGDSWQ